MSPIRRITVLTGATLMAMCLCSARGQEQDIFQVLSANNSTKTFVKFAVDTDIVNILQSQGPYTVLVPSDQAFETFKTKNPVLYKKVVADRNLLKQLLEYHMINSVTMAADFKDSAKLTTLEGDQIRVGVTAKGARFNRTAMITTSDLKVSNGVIQIIDTVLIPKEVRAAAKGHS